MFSGIWKLADSGSEVESSERVQQFVSTGKAELNDLSANGLTQFVRLLLTVEQTRVGPLIDHRDLAVADSLQTLVTYVSGLFDDLNLDVITLESSINTVQQLEENLVKQLAGLSCLELLLCHLGLPLSYVSLCLETSPVTTLRCEVCGSQLACMCQMRKAL